MTTKTLFIIKQREIINKNMFTILVLNLEVEIFVIYIVSIFSSIIMVESF